MNWSMKCANCDLDSMPSLVTDLQWELIVSYLSKRWYFIARLSSYILLAGAGSFKSRAGTLKTSACSGEQYRFVSIQLCIDLTVEQ